MTTPRADTLLGGRYRLTAVLGRGGMAEVFDAFDERLHRPVAVKVLRPEMAAQPDVRGRFEAEARSAARLGHPNVVAIYDTGEDDDVPFIVMERLPGETLADRMAARPVEADWLLEVSGDVLVALGAAHAAGLVHRDVKPGNILIDRDGRAKVADFGIAKSLEVAAAADLTATNQLVGTPAYVAPERLRGEPATAQADLYALGVVLYEALAGQKPFSGPTPVATAYAITHETPRPLGELRPDLPEGLVSVVERALAKDPAQRFASASEMASALRAGGDLAAGGAVGEATQMAPLADSTQVLPAPPGPAWLPAWFARRRRPPAVAALIATLVLVALLALVAGAVTRTSDPAGRVAGELREVAGELGTADGPASAQAAERLRALAATVEAGGGAAEANALLTQLAVWRDTGQLTAAAVGRMRTVVNRVPGADPGAFASPTTTAPPPPEEGDDKEDDDKEDEEEKGQGSGKGKKGRG